MLKDTHNICQYNLLSLGETNETNCPETNYPIPSFLDLKSLSLFLMIIIQIRQTFNQLMEVSDS